jgi:hypothetical protein
LRRENGTIKPRVSAGFAYLVSPKYISPFPPHSCGEYYRRFGRNGSWDVDGDSDVCGVGADVACY